MLEGGCHETGSRGPRHPAPVPRGQSKHREVTARPMKQTRDQLLDAGHCGQGRLSFLSQSTLALDIGACFIQSLSSLRFPGIAPKRSSAAKGCFQRVPAIRVCTRGGDGITLRRWALEVGAGAQRETRGKQEGGTMARLEGLGLRK